MRPVLSVVIPAYNEAVRLPPTLREAFAWLSAHEPAHEIIVVDDGSRDETYARAEALREEIPTLRVKGLGENQGKGAAVRAGMLAARGRFRLFMDADHSTHIREWRKAKALLEEGADVAIASRKAPGAELAVRQPWWRERMGEAFNLLVRTRLGLRFRDTQCGFKAFTAEAAERIFARLRLRGFGFDVEILWLAEHMGLKVVEFPVLWANDPDSRVVVGRDLWRVWREVSSIPALHEGEER
ncbi:MAG: glycosyltransferase family 2 protein [Zetaproteobacteria bacterium]|nr:MAG: glycosyltransferase family 2 protein [Zetaproteobacteria bacterium]